MKMTSKDRAKLIPRLALRWSKLIAEDVQTDGFWQDALHVFGVEEFSDAETNTIKGWVRDWAARVTRVFG